MWRFRWVDNECNDKQGPCGPKQQNKAGYEWLCSDHFLAKRGIALLTYNSIPYHK